jgi:hypothetical protein
LANFSVRWADSEIQRAQSLVVEMIDSLLRCPAERKEAATREALVKLKPHLETAVETLETIGRVRGLTDEELVRLREFMKLLSAASWDD